MKIGPIWDAHVHLFPPEIYHNWDKYAALDPWFAALTKEPEKPTQTAEAWANLEEALETADKAGIQGLVMQGWYWNDPGLVVMHNDYMAQGIAQYPDRLRGFASINPKFGPAAVREVERCAALGFSGVGELGPGGNGYDFTDPDLMAVLECCQHHRLPVCIHCGETIGHDYHGRDKTPLGPILDIVQRFPDLVLILAHMGGGVPFYEMNPRIQRLFQNVYYDTAANPLLYHIRSIRAVLEMVGPDKLLYGSDFPLLLYPRRCREMDFSLFLTDIREKAGLSEEELQKFLSANLCRLLHIDTPA